MTRYKGIIFNSHTVGRLEGALAARVRELNVKTAVVTNHKKTETFGRLEEKGISVDYVIGGGMISTVTARKRSRCQTRSSWPSPTLVLNRRT